MKKVIAINTGPRKGWNTDQLIKEAAKGAEEAYDAAGYTAMLESYRNTLNTFVSPTSILTCGNTLQVKDYSLYNWTLFDGDAKPLTWGSIF